MNNKKQWLDPEIVELNIVNTSFGGAGDEDGPGAKEASGGS